MVESELRSLYDSKEKIASDPIIKAYKAFYKSFKKTYHVLGQLDSVCLKGKGIPSVNALVECMFMAELRNRILTAGHDMRYVEPSLGLHCSKGDESFETIRGANQTLKPGDMYICDNQGIISSVIYGPDKRTVIRDDTTNVIYTCYSPKGVPTESVESHLRLIERYVKLVCPDSKTLDLEIHCTS